LLGLLREEKSLAAKVLSELKVELASTRDGLSQTPHDDSKIEEFERDHGPLPADVVELQNRVKTIRASLEEAIGNHDFEKARSGWDEEGTEREKLLRLYHRYGLLGWIYD
jgi:hypothetical protein